MEEHSLSRNDLPMAANTTEINFFMYSVPPVVCFRFHRKSLFYSIQNFHVTNVSASIAFPFPAKPGTLFFSAGSNHVALSLPFLMACAGFQHTKKPASAHVTRICRHLKNIIRAGFVQKSALHRSRFSFAFGIKKKKALIHKAFLMAAAIGFETFRV